MRGKTESDHIPCFHRKAHGVNDEAGVFLYTSTIGKVLTPLKVHSARLPSAFRLFYVKIGKLDKKLLLPPEIALLIRQQVLRINVCLFCIDIGRWATIKTLMNEAKFEALEQYRTSELFPMQSVRTGLRDGVDE